MKRKTFFTVFLMVFLMAVMVFGIGQTAVATCNNCHSSPGTVTGKIVLNTDSAAGLPIMSLTTNRKNNDTSGTANGTTTFEQAAINTREANNLTGNQYTDSNTGSSLRRNGETANTLETLNLRRMVNVKNDIGAKVGILEARSRIRAADGGYLSSSGMIT